MASLRRRYGPVLAPLASSLTDFHVRRSDVIHTPGLTYAATSMIAAVFMQSIEPMAKPTGNSNRQARHHVGASSAAIQLTAFRLSLSRGGKN